MDVCIKFVIVTKMYKLAHLCFNKPEPPQLPCKKLA